MIVEILAVKADIPAFELLCDIRLDLAATRTVVTNVARAVPNVAEAAQVERRVRAKAAAVIEIGAVFAVVESGGDAERTAFAIAGLRDEVDDTARRVRREGRRGTAANRFDARNAVVGAQEDVGIAEGDVAEFEDRQPVFLQLQELRAARRNR